MLSLVVRNNLLYSLGAHRVTLAAVQVALPSTLPYNLGPQIACPRRNYNRTDRLLPTDRNIVYTLSDLCYEGRSISFLAEAEHTQMTLTKSRLHTRNVGIAWYSELVLLDAAPYAQRANRKHHSAYSWLIIKERILRGYDNGYRCRQGAFHPTLGLGYIGAIHDIPRERSEFSQCAVSYDSLFH